MDLTADESGELRPQKASQLRWDRKRKRFTKTSNTQSSKQMVRSESGALIPATYDSGRFERWQKGGSSASKQGVGRRVLLASLMSVLLLNLSSELEVRTDRGPKKGLGSKAPKMFGETGQTLKKWVPLESI